MNVFFSPCWFVYFLYTHKLFVVLLYLKSFFVLGYMLINLCQHLPANKGLATDS